MQNNFYSSLDEFTTQVNKEIWIDAYYKNKKLDGYEVSNHGRIRSYLVGSRIDYNKEPKILKGDFKKGYPCVRFVTRSKNAISIHTIVTNSFQPLNPNEDHKYKLQSIFTENNINPESWKFCPYDNISHFEWYETDRLTRTQLKNLVRKQKLHMEASLQDDHLDGDKSNNKVSNLRRSTHEQNIASYHENIDRSCPEKYRSTIHKVICMIDPNGKIIYYKGIKTFCQILNLDRRSINKVIRGKQTSHKNFKKAEKYYDYANEVAIGLLKKDGHKILDKKELENYAKKMKKKLKVSQS